MSNLIQAPVFNGTIKLDGQMPVEFSSADIAVPNQFPTVSGLDVSGTAAFLVTAVVSGSLGATSLTVSGTGVTGVVSGMGVSYSVDYALHASQAPAVPGIVQGTRTVSPITNTTIHISPPLTAAISNVSVGFYKIPVPCNYPAAYDEPSVRAGATRQKFPVHPATSMAYLPLYTKH